ncbi:MAG TPA: hypothetical protein VEK33_01075 [Terriglobales bacterium]|nr:hypothetical protein [Terriglobales bacterium]
MKNHLSLRMVGAFLVSVAMVPFSANGAAAQRRAQMPATGFNPYAWMTHLDNVGRQQVRQMYALCIHHPGACRGLATPESLSNAINGVQQQSLNNSAHTQQNMQKTWNSISSTNCAVTGGVVRWNRATQQNECYR